MSPSLVPRLLLVLAGVVIGSDGALPPPVEPMDPASVGTLVPGMVAWNAKYPGKEPPVLFWPLIDQDTTSFARGDAGAESAQAASEAAASEAAASPGKAPYLIPQYPLPPPPQSAPPPTMPFANLDLGNFVGHMPPPGIVILAPGEGTLAGGEAIKNDDVKDGSYGIPYESPPSSSEAMAGAEAAQMSGIKESLGVDPKVFLRKDSPNPYCDICIAHASAPFWANGCKQLPQCMQTSCDSLQPFFTGNKDFIELTAGSGCVDKTGPTPQIGMPGDPAAKCPPLIACNIISTEEGAPLCGQRLRSWGDFMPEVAKNRPIRPDLPIVSQDPNRFSPPPYLGVYEGNPYCNVCAAVMNSKAMDAADFANPTPEQRLDICLGFPMSLRYLCMDYVPKVLDYPDLKAVKSTCKDQTVPGGGGECGGLALCNAMLSKGGKPLCGSVQGNWGKFDAAA